MSIRNKLSQSLAAGALIAMCSFGASANLVFNPSFENPDTSQAPPEYPGATGWTAFGGVFTVEDYTGALVAQDGNQVLKTFGGNSGVFQDFAVNPGDIVTGTAYAGSDSTDPMSGGKIAAVNIEWLDAGGNQIVVSFGSTIDASVTQDIWTQIGVVGAVAPAGSAFARLALVSGDYAGAGGGAPKFDSASLTVSAVPVPAAVWLFGSGLVGLVGVARRRKS